MFHKIPSSGWRRGEAVSENREYMWRQRPRGLRRWKEGRGEDFVPDHHEAQREITGYVKSARNEAGVLLRTAEEEMHRWREP